MKVLVTGGGGFAGRHLLRELLSRRVDRIAATVLGEVPTFSPGDPLSPVQWLSMDLESTDSIQEVLQASTPEVIFHLAGQASVGQSFEAPLETWDANATGTLRLFSAIARQPGTPRRILLASSAEVYGEVDPLDLPIGEDAPIRPLTPYGSSKAAAELLSVQMGRALGLEVVIARSFNHIGPGQDARFVLPSVALQLRRMRNRESEQVLKVGNLEVERDFLDVRDVARAYALLMERGSPGEVYNVCSGAAHSLLFVVQRLVALSGTGVRIEVDPDRVRPVDIPLLVGNPSRLKELGWESRFGLDETLRDLLSEAEARE